MLTKSNKFPTYKLLIQHLSLLTHIYITFYFKGTSQMCTKSFSHVGSFLRESKKQFIIKIKNGYL